jgi:hypothetical protein
MCIAAAAIPAATLAISAVSTVASIGMGIMSAQMQAQQAQAQLSYQARAQQQQMEQQRQQMLQQQQQQYQGLELQQRQNQQNYNLQVEQANAQMVNQYNQARQQVLNERSTIMARNAADRLTYQRTFEEAQAQIGNNNEAANKVYVAEQTKLNEARKQAAFEQQAILAKSIGNAGNVLAAGRTGQSIGLLLNDVERQKGFALAQDAASFDSKRDAALISMDTGWLQAKSQNNRAISGIAWNPSNPYLPEFPDIPTFIGGIGIEANNPSRRS